MANGKIIRTQPNLVVIFLSFFTALWTVSKYLRRSRATITGATESSHNHSRSSVSENSTPSQLRTKVLAASVDQSSSNSELRAAPDQIDEDSPITLFPCLITATTVSCSICLHRLKSGKNHFNIAGSCSDFVCTGCSHKLVKGAHARVEQQIRHNRGPKQEKINEPASSPNIINRLRKHGTVILRSNHGICKVRETITIFYIERNKNVSILKKFPSSAPEKAVAYLLKQTSA